MLALAAVNYGDRPLIERRLHCLASWLTPDGHLFMRADPGMATGPGLNFFPWAEENTDPPRDRRRPAPRRPHPLRHLHQPPRHPRTPPGLALPPLFLTNGPVPGQAGGGSAMIWWRRRVRVLVMSRDTCIWEIPISSAISRWFLLP